MKNEFVMVPRELAEEINAALTFSGYVSLPRALQVAMAKPAEQHQDEPVAWRYRHSKPGMSWFFTEKTGADGCLIDGFDYEVQPLYTHADPAGDPAGSFDKHMEYMDRCHKLEKKLAEAHALLRDIELTMDAQEDSVSLGYDIEMRMATILRASASAEPAQPELVECDACPRSGGCVNTCMKAPASAEPSDNADLGSCHRRPAWATDGRINTADAPVERAEFESKFSTFQLQRHPQHPDCYENPGVHYVWQGWQARAALERKS